MMSTNFMIEMLMNGIACMLIGFTYSVVLTQPDYLLEGWRNYWKQKLMRREVFESSPQRWEPGGEAMLEVLTDNKWLFKLIVDCETCISGQIALWYYLVTHWNGGYHFMQHLLIISAAIISAELLKPIYKCQKRKLTITD